MGIVYGLIRADPSALEQLRDRPAALSRFIYQDADVYEAPKPGFLDRLLGRSSERAGPVPSRTHGDEIDLDKLWHIVHYLLAGETGRADGPLGLIADDLHPLANLDLGLGKPNLVSAERVAAFSAAAGRLSDDEFLSRYRPDEMPAEDLYLGEVIARGDDEEMRDDALEKFHLLRDFTGKAAASGEAVVTYYS